MQGALTTRRSLMSGVIASVVFLSKPAYAGYRSSTFDWGQIELLDSDDRLFSVDQSPQPWVLIKLWANWCSACMRELDSVANITPALGAQNIDVVMVSHPDDWALNQQVTRGRNLPVRSARPSPMTSPSAIQAGLLNADGDFFVPRSMLFDRRSRSIVWSHMGGVDWSTQAAFEPIRRWVG